MKQWYTHLVEIESVILKLEKMNLSKTEKVHLAKLADASLHHTILDAVFSQLKDQDKELFMTYLNENDHAKIWQFLNEKIDKVEEKIKKVADDLKSELHKDLQEANSSE